MKLHVPPSEPTGDVDLTPMIDVVFLLVIFFMVTTTFIEEAKVYEIQLPKARNPKTIARENQPMLSVTFDGSIYLKAGKGEEQIDDLGVVIEKLKELHKTADTKKGIILRCDGRSEYERYVQAKNAIRLAGWELIFEEVEVKR